MATATATKDDEKAAKAKEKERAAKAKEKERLAKEKEKEKAAKAKEKEKAAKAKEKEKAAKAKEKERLAKEKEKAAKAKEKEKEKAAKAEEKEAGKEGTAARSRGAGTGPKSRGGSSRPAKSSPSRDGSPRPQVHEKGWIAEELGKGDAVTRSTKRPTLAASFTTRDHDVIRRWAESRGGTPADVRGTGDGNSTGGAGVLRIEFRDDQDRLEDVGWDAFFATFEDSDVDFLYQEFTKDGGESRFHKIVRADD